MRLAVSLIAAAAVFLLAPAAGASDSEQTQLERVWENTLVVTPKDPNLYIFRVRNLDMVARTLGAGRKYPAVVFLHGCSGLFTSSPQVTRMVRDMAAAGFVVFAPNSLDRPHDPYCDPKTLKSYIDDKKVQNRINEAKSTFDRVSKLDFIDAENIFLAGHSMGGMTVHNYSGSEFRAYAVLGYHCGPHTYRNLEGIKTPTDRPLLTVRGDADEWYINGPNRTVHCGQYMRNHPLGKSVVLPGAPHDISSHPDGMKIVTEFLLANIGK